jgi:hypothetical protein
MGWISTMSSLHSASCLARSGVRHVSANRSPLAGADDRCLGPCRPQDDRGEEVNVHVRGGDILAWPDMAACQTSSGDIDQRRDQPAL